MYEPPFTITAKILNLVASISEKVGAINSDLLQNSPELRKQNRIKTITGTLAIEGNTLTEEQITAILEGKRVMGTVRELAEVQGAIKAYEALESLNPNSIEHLLEAHGLMMSDILSDAGEFRTKSVGIHKGDKVVHIAPPAHMVAGQISDLLRWIENSEFHPLITSTIFHYEFEFIHPFIDGNGRMGRLWQTLILSKWKPLFISLPLESVIKDNQEQYYKALEQSDAVSDSSSFVEFMLYAIDNSISENVLVNVSKNVLVNLKPVDAVLQLIKDNVHITRKEMAYQIGKDIRTIGRAIKKLQESGKLKRICSAKTGYWEIINE